VCLVTRLLTALNLVYSSPPLERSRAGSEPPVVIEFANSLQRPSPLVGTTGHLVVLVFGSHVPPTVVVKFGFLVKGLSRPVSE
jgi:hypothetical protein